MISIYRQIKNHQRSYFYLLFICLLLFTSGFISIVQADEDEDDENELEDDDYGDIGWVAIFSFVVSGLYVIFIKVVRVYQKSLRQPHVDVEHRKRVNQMIKRIRQPFAFIHYLSGTLGVGIVLIHGIGLITEDPERSLFGIISVIIFLYYIISGIIVKVRFHIPKQIRWIRRFLDRSHQSLILFFIVILLHIIHVAS